MAEEGGVDTKIRGEERKPGNKVQREKELLTKEREVEDSVTERNVGEILVNGMRFILFSLKVFLSSLITGPR